MTDITFSKEQKAVLVQRIKLYFREELEQDLGQFDAEFLLDFFSEEIGGHWFNQGVDAARQVIEQRTVDITDALLDIEQPTPQQR